MKFLPPPHSRLRCFIALFLVLLLLLSLAPTAFAEDELTAKNINGYYTIFANGNPIRLEAGTPDNYTKVFVGDNPVELPSSVNGVVLVGNKDDGYDLSKAYIVGGSDGRTEPVSVKSTSITMTGGKVFRILAGNYGSESKGKENVSRVTGDATVDISGGEISGGEVVGYINAGRCNTSIEGTFKLTITGGTFGENCYVHAGVWGNGKEGSADYGIPEIITTAHVNNAVVNISDVSIYVLACGGGGYTSVGTAEVTVENSTIGNLYSGGINGMVEESTITLIDTDVTSYAGVNRGYARDVELNVTKDSTIGELYVSTAPGAFGSDSGLDTGAGVIGSSTIHKDSTSEVNSAVLTPTVRAEGIDKVTTSTPEITSNIPLTVNNSVDFGKNIKSEGVTVTKPLNSNVILNNSTMTLDEDVVLNGDVSADASSTLSLSQGSQVTGSVSDNITVESAGDSPVTYTITSSSTGKGTVNLSDKVVEVGRSVTATITPGSASRISDVKINGKSVGAVSKYTIPKVYQDYVISATFASLAPIEGVVVSGGEEEQPGEEEDGSQAATPTYAVICRKLNVRSGPGTSYDRIGSLSRGALLSGVLENGWLRFTYNGQTAYVSATYVQKLNGSGDLCVLCNALNVRTGPSTSYAKLGQLLSGTYVDPLESQNGWYKIGYNGGYGWICADYVG